MKNSCAFFMAACIMYCYILLANQWPWFWFVAPRIFSCYHSAKLLILAIDNLCKFYGFQTTMANALAVEYIDSGRSSNIAATATVDDVKAPLLSHIWKAKNMTPYLRTYSARSWYDANPIVVTWYLGVEHQWTGNACHISDMKIYIRDMPICKNVHECSQYSKHRLDMERSTSNSLHCTCVMVI
jgi:hypothetical protein